MKDRSMWGRRALVAGLVALFLGLAGCASAPVDPGPDYDRMQRSTVLIEVLTDDRLTSKGAGVLTEHGVLTAAHLVDNLRESQSVRVRFYGGEYAPATVERMEHRMAVAEALFGQGNVLQYRKDMALLSIPGGAGYPRSEINCERQRVGATVYSVGHPLSMEWVVTRGEVITTRPRFGYSEGRWLAVNAVSAPGNSGGPLYDDAGRVVGIMSHSMLRGVISSVGGGVGVPSGHNFAASGAAICEFLEPQTIPFVIVAE